MSLKNDIEMVKDELTSEEKFFEKAVMTEKFVKKYKKIMIGSAVAIAVFVSGSIIYSYMEESRVEEANLLFLELKSDKSNPAAIARLASLSPALHDVWSYSEAMTSQNIEELEKLQKSKAQFIADLSSYEVAQRAADTEKLQSYMQKQNALYADLAALQAAIIFMQDDEIEKAHRKLKTIAQDSPLAEVASSLMHYGVK